MALSLFPMGGLSVVAAVWKANLGDPSGEPQGLIKSFDPIYSLSRTTISAAVSSPDTTRYSTHEVAPHPARNDEPPLRLPT
jgi:hypothetical protein